jgi:hypothetical protein
MPIATVISTDVISGPHPAEAPFGVDAFAQDARAQQHD